MDNDFHWETKPSRRSSEVCLWGDEGGRISAQFLSLNASHSSPYCLFHLPWFLQGPTRLANYATRLKGANEMLESESGGGYTAFFTALLEMRKGEPPQSFQPQPSRNM